MLAEGGNERERQQGRDRQPDRRGEQVPVAGRACIGQAAAAQAADPGQDRREARHVEQGCQPQHPYRERAKGAVAEGERSTGGTGSGQLRGNQGGNDEQDERRPGEVSKERPGDRRLWA